MYVLDTDIIIAILKGNAKVLEYIRKKIYTTMINMAELYYFVVNFKRKSTMPKSHFILFHLYIKKVIMH